MERKSNRYTFEEMLVVDPEGYGSNTIVPTPQGMKHDVGKRRVDLISPAALHDLADVLTFGADKYGARNWETGLIWSRVYGAALRHLLAFWSGEDNDPESGLPHTAHAMCCMMFLLEYRNTRPELDDRKKNDYGKK